MISFINFTSRLVSIVAADEVILNVPPDGREALIAYDTSFSTHIPVIDEQNTTISVPLKEYRATHVVLVGKNGGIYNFPEPLKNTFYIVSHQVCLYLNRSDVVSSLQNDGNTFFIWISKMEMSKNGGEKTHQKV
jgi:hypothetical protein